MADYPDFAYTKQALQVTGIGKYSQFNDCIDMPVDAGESFALAYHEGKGVIWGFAAEVRQDPPTDTGLQQKFRITIDDNVLFANNLLNPHLINRKLGITSPVVGMPFSTVYDDSNGRWTIAWIFPYPIRFNKIFELRYINDGTVETDVSYIVMWWKEYP